MQERNEIHAPLRATDADAWLRRFPDPGNAVMLLRVLAVLANSALVLWLLARGHLTPVGLILLVAGEFILLLAIAWITALVVPVRDWYEPPPKLRDSAAAMAFFFFWCAGAYALTITLLAAWPIVLKYREAGYWLQSGLALALAVTVLLALINHLFDLQHWRRHGPPYLPSAGLDVATRMLTLILGGIPFASVIFLTFIGFAGMVQLTGKHGRNSAALVGVGWVALVLVIIAGIALGRWLVSTGVHIWAVGFVVAKVCADLLVCCVPLVMREVARRGR